jgi:hypothetical protein
MDEAITLTTLPVPPLSYCPRPVSPRQVRGVPGGAEGDPECQAPGAEPRAAQAHQAASHGGWVWIRGMGGQLVMVSDIFVRILLGKLDIF